MKVAICDDEVFYREQILELTQKYATQNKSKEITVTAFTHAEELLDTVSKSGGFDIYILDVIMPGMNGIELGKALREKGYDERIIYLTTSDEFALASYKVNASDYIIKPATEDEFISSLDRVVKSVSDIKDKFIIIKTKDGSVKLNFDNLVYAELTKRTVIYHLRDGKTIESVYIRTNFGDTVKDLVSDKRFAFCGKSLLLNLHHISAVQNEAIVFDSSEKIFAGKKLCRELHNAWVNFNFSEVNGI